MEVSNKNVCVKAAVLLRVWVTQDLHIIFFLCFFFYLFVFNLLPGQTSLIKARAVSGSMVYSNQYNFVLLSTLLLFIDTLAQILKAVIQLNDDFSEIPVLLK